MAIAAVQQAARLSQHILSQAQQQHDKQQQHDDSSTTSSKGPPVVVPQQKDMGVVAKDDLSPVTIADFAIQALLTCTLHHAFPGDRFVGEESSAALRENPALLDRVWGSLLYIAEHSTEGEKNDDDGVVVRIPSSPDEMCDMIDWCGNGQPSVAPDATSGASASARVWVFDPIDGTENFVKGLIYAINVALLDAAEGRQVLSVVGCPNLSVDVSFPATDASLDPAGEGALAYGVRGRGAFWRKLHGPNLSDDDVAALGRNPQEQEQEEEEGERRKKEEGAGAGTASRRLPRHADSADAIRSVTATSVTSGLTAVHAAVADRLGVAFPGNDLLPWVLRWLLLALGVGNATWWAYKSRGRLGKIWDHAGAMLLFEEVGGKITDVDGRALDLFAGRKMVGNYGVVAAPARLHGRVLGAVREALGRERPELMEGSSVGV